jgi:hypothetical protein
MNLSEVARKPAREIDEMNALIEHLAATGDHWVRSPFSLVADAPTVTVTGANVHQWADCPAIE